MAQIDGNVAAGFERVADAFERNFEDFDESGATLCLYLDGRPVVDLWGGVDPVNDRRYTADTLGVVFSCTKGATALCAHKLVERGLLDVDAPVARYWPEFAAAGKEEMPVRWLLCHATGLPYFDPDGDVTVEGLLSWGRCVEALAAQAPWWEPGTAYSYHPVTFGFLVGEVIRRVGGRSVGCFFAEEVAGPLGLDFWIGLPASAEARLAPSLPPSVPRPGLPELLAALEGQGVDTRSRAVRALSGAGEFLELLNTAPYLAAEIPAANGVTNARGLARMYAACVGEVDGVRLLAPATVEAARMPQTDQLSSPPELAFMNIGEQIRFGLGFELPRSRMPLLGPDSFGHSGAGGRLGFAVPDARLAFGYVSNKMLRQGSDADPRWSPLLDAVRFSLPA